MQRSALCRSRREVSNDIWLQSSASIQRRTSPVKFARSPRTDPPGLTLVSRPELPGARISAPPEFLPRASALTHERSFFLSAAVLRASFFFIFPGWFNRVQQGMSTSFRVRDFFLFVSFSRFRNTFRPPVAMLIAASAAFFTS